MIKVLKIGKEEIKINTDVIAGIGSDLTDDMDKVSSLIATYGAYLAAAKREQILQKATYRHWKARFKKKLFDAEPKLADKKADAEVEAQKTFMDYKEQEGLCLENVEFLEKLVEALKEKSPNLRSRGAWERKEFESHGMTTKVDIDAKKEKLRQKSAKQPVTR